MPDINKEETPTHFNSYEIAGVVKAKSGETGYQKQAEMCRDIAGQYEELAKQKENF